MFTAEISYLWSRTACLARDTGPPYRNISTAPIAIASSQPSVRPLRVNGACHVITQTTIGSALFLKSSSSLTVKEVSTFELLLKCRPRTTDNSTQLYYQPRNRAKSIEPTKSPCHKWEVTPRKYYDTLNIVVVLKSRLGFDARIWISIVIFDREGRPSMRLRRRPFQIREPLRSVSQVISSRRTQRTLN